MPEAGYGAYDEIFLEPVGLICRDGQKENGGESKNFLPIFFLSDIMVLKRSWKIDRACERKTLWII